MSYRPVQMPMAPTLSARVESVMGRPDLAAELNAMTERAEKAEATIRFERARATQAKLDIEALTARAQRAEWLLDEAINDWDGPDE